MITCSAIHSHRNSGQPRGGADVSREAERDAREALLYTTVRLMREARSGAGKDDRMELLKVIRPERKREAWWPPLLQRGKYRA